MAPRFYLFIRVIAALLAAPAIAPLAGAADQPVVKKSRAGICHERGSPGYEQTIHFKAFGTIQACLKSGGRLPKNSSNKKPKFDPFTPAHPGDDGVLFGPLVRAIDGDTIVVKVQGADLSFRLSGIDAPEADQPFGEEARIELVSLIGQKECVLVYANDVTFDRLVAHLWIGDTYVNAELVKRGMAWFDSESAANDYLFDLEEEARTAKRGLWALPLEKRVQPRDWRDGVR